MIEVEHPVLVGAQWLMEHLGEPDLVVLDASITRGEDDEGRTVFTGGEETFVAGHVPGAVFADLFGVWSDPEGEFGFTRPTAAQVRAAAMGAGISPHSHVVVYDQLSGAYAARLWLVLRSYGFPRVSVLDGGLAAWTAAGGAVEQGPGHPMEGLGFTPLEVGGFTDLTEVRSIALGEASHDVDAAGEPRLVCALRSPEFLGDPERDRSGHIPGSVNLPYPDLLADDGTISVERTRALAAELGISDGADVIAYCGGGVNAAGLALAFAQAGLGVPRVYDASLNEWRARTELPMALGADGVIVPGPGARESVILFDIDGTLLHSNGEHNDIITEVMARHGLDATIKPFGTYTHYTDACVVGEVHEATHGVAAPAELLVQLDREYREALEARIAERPLLEVPGARRLVEELASMPGVHLAYATGSLRAMAALKLSVIGVDADEAALATSSECYTREELAHAAMAQVSERLGHDRLDVVALGDGEWDERTAGRLGVPFVGLATGEYAFGASALLVLEDYRDVSAADLVALARPWTATLPQDGSGEEPGDCVEGRGDGERA